jgi:hypothetical protein
LFTRGGPCILEKLVTKQAVDARAATIRLAALLPTLNGDQMRIVESLIEQRARAATALADATSLMRTAALRDDREAFVAARATAEEAAEGCRAATHALSVALAAFGGSLPGEPAALQPMARSGLAVHGNAQAR